MRSTIATNTPTSYAATNLPSGLSLNTTTGLISGSSTQSGTFNISLTATNGSAVWLSGFLMLCIVYYGGADKYCCLATCDFERLLTHLRNCPP